MENTINVDALTSTEAQELILKLVQKFKAQVFDYKTGEYFDIWHVADWSLLKKIVLFVQHEVTYEV